MNVKMKKCGVSRLREGRGEGGKVVEDGGSREKTACLKVKLAKSDKRWVAGVQVSKLLMDSANQWAS